LKWSLLSKLTRFVFLLSSMLGPERLSELSPEQAEFVRKEDGGMSLMEVTEKYKPTMLLGMTAVGGIFKEDLIREMASHCERPVIFPLSNPTTSAECTAEQAFEWTDGKCIFASGSPFAPVELDDGRVFYPSQCNNSESVMTVMIVVVLFTAVIHLILTLYPRLNQCTSFQVLVWE